MANMIGKFCPDGPGGRDCYCCGQPPGGKRKKARRSVKRGKKNNAWRKEVW
jgi:hypothetical protein